MQVNIEDLYEEPEEPALFAMDAEDLHDLLGICHCLLSEVIERKLPQRLHNDIARTLNDLDEVLSWQITM